MMMFFSQKQDVNQPKNNLQAFSHWANNMTSQFIEDFPFAGKKIPVTHIQSLEREVEVKTTHNPTSVLERQIEHAEALRDAMREDGQVV
jgi:hypothetical protein